jgi:hypothetical protein
VKLAPSEASVVRQEAATKNQRRHRVCDGGLRILAILGKHTGEYHVLRDKPGVGLSGRAGVAQKGHRGTRRFGRLEN